MVLEVIPSRKFSSFGFLPYTYPERIQTAIINTNNRLLTPLDRSIDSAARDYFRNPYAVGLSIGVIKEGKRFAYHYGETVKGSNRIPDNKTLYELGSIVKTFTSTILANAVLEKRVRLTDDIRRYLPEPYPNLAYRGQAITLQDLANHTSRIPSVLDDFYADRPFDPLNPWSRYTKPMLYQFLHRVVIDTLPGYKEQYSNVGVALLGQILETVYTLSYDDLTQKYVTIPFNMTGTGTQISREREHDVAAKYSANGNPVPFWHSPVFKPAGVGMVTCLDDMLNYVDSQILESNEAITLTHQLTANNMGLGWGIGNIGTTYKNQWVPLDQLLGRGIGNIGTTYKKYEHSGGTNGFTTNVRVFPEVKAGLVILASNDVALANLIRRLSSLISQ